MSDDDQVQRWFDGLSYRLKRDLAGTIKKEADGLAEAIRAKTPVKTRALARSVRVRRKRNELDLEVTAGGEETTKEVRSGSGAQYDYAMATEFGSQHQPAQPFFYNTARELMPGIRQNIEDAVAEAITKS